MRRGTPTLIGRGAPPETFTATAGQTQFTLAYAPGTTGGVAVFVDGAIQTDYGIADKTLTFDTGLTVGQKVVVVYLGLEMALGAPADGSVTLAKMDTTAANLARAFGARLLHVRDEKASGTAGGASTTGVWNTRVLNTAVVNEITGASLASNQITLPAGKYWVEARAPAFACGRHKAQLYNVTDGATAAVGGSDFSETTYFGHCHSFVRGRFTLAASKVLELRQYFQTGRATNGLGVESSSGSAEVYAEVMIWRIGEA